MSKPHDAMLWEPVDDSGDNKTVRCSLCAHRCTIAPGKFGFCNVRQNIGGKLMTHTFDQVIACSVDPIEKKPLFHFLPGSETLSIATPGCNFRCEFCQNWNISQTSCEHSENISLSRQADESLTPETIVALAMQRQCESISYTYTEPTIFFELAYETSKLARAGGLRNCFVSNGFMTPETVQTIAPHLDAINVDLKTFRDETYRKVCSGRLEPVLNTLQLLVGLGVWVEVTTLIVPGLNDSPQELGDIAEFIATKLGVGVPWHVSRFHGSYKMQNRDATPIATLQLACELGARTGLEYVYCGNATGAADESTYCPHCQMQIIERAGFAVGKIHLDNGRCPKCNQTIPGVWR
ncbi:MAG: AmmeMemoRadiSam system radical SAM enzyme [Phycisphaerae bacterium]|nr:AmmeMemoRadiSam system radical SAM enzyme [Phycisphaerae bacterium]